MSPKKKADHKVKDEKRKKVASKPSSDGNRERATAGKAAKRARPGDIIVIDSAQVGSPPREGEIIMVIERDVAISYRVRWGDGHETLITPAAGTAHVIPKRRPERT
jgi:hypothetical protein